MKINSNEIYEILKICKADDISFITKDNVTYIVANEYTEQGVNQVIKKIDDYGDDFKTTISKNILKLLPKRTKIEITKDTIIAENRKIKYKCEDAIIAEKPLKVESYLTTIKIGELKHLLSGDYAMDTSMVRPTLNGICINKNNFVALDGFRLSVRKGNFEAKEQIIININLVNMLKKIKYDRDVEVYYSDRYVKFIFGDLEIIGERIEGDYIKYNQIIPTEYTTKIKTETKPILNILKDYKKNKFEVVKLNFTKNKLMLSASNDVATVQDRCCIKLQGEPLKIAFNPKYLIDCFKNYEVATLELTSRVSPLVVKSDNKLDLVLPVRLKEY